MALLADLSVKIFNNGFRETEYRILSRGGVRHVSGIFVTQFAIEYLVNLFLISGSNDYKRESLKNKDNLFGLFNIYQNSILTHKYDVKEHGATSLIIPIAFQQFRSQLDPKNMFIRQMYLFGYPAQDGGINLDDVFFKNVGLTISDYLRLTFIYFALATQQKPHFTRNIRFEGSVTIFKEVLIQEKVDKFLDFLSLSYNDFRILDDKLNQNSEVGTKSRFNPLWIKPIVKLQDNTYLIPSISAYFTACFDGLFWFFDNYFKENDEEGLTKFRKEFGKNNFEKYVGDNLNYIYGNKGVDVGIKYGKGSNSEFFDWIVKKGNKRYLIEAKAYQFSLFTLQTGNLVGVKSEIKKIVDTIVQMYKRIKDIYSYSELNDFKNTENIPIAIFYKIPFISGPMYNEYIFEEISKLEEKYIGIKDFKFHLMSIEELEIFFHASHVVDVEDILVKVKNDHIGNFVSEVGKIVEENGNRGRNIIEKEFDGYFKGVE